MAGVTFGTFAALIKLKRKIAMPQAMSSAQALVRANTLDEWLDQLFDEFEFKRDNRNIFAVGCFHAAMEYQRAIVALIGIGLPGAAFALVRPIFEAVARGFWLRYCANEAALKRFSNDEDIGQFGSLLADLEKVDGFGVGILMGIKTRSWKAMNSYIHTGISQVSRRYSEDSVETNFSDEEKCEVVNFSCAMSAVAAIAICEVADREKEAISILEKIKEMGFAG